MYGIYTFFHFWQLFLLTKYKIQCIINMNENLSAFVKSRFYVNVKFVAILRNTVTVFSGREYVP